MSKHRSTRIQGLPPALARLIHAAEFRRERGEGRDVRGVARALREFGVLARWALPTHGVFVPNNNNVSLMVDQVANDHLGLADARRAFRDAVELVESFERRDPIESAHGYVRSVSDEAYFYAGLAWGLALTDHS